ncbi:MAG TPA: SDR family oxidoreductase [Solirubrobacteraceae bacterium]
MLLVIGGTGTVGSEVIRQLQAAGRPVRALVRTQGKADAVRAAGAEPVLGDVADPATLGPALDGVARLFVVLSGGPDHVQLETNVIDAAAAKGDVTIVKLSVIGADPDSSVRFAAAHGRIEQVLAASGVPHTLLRPNDFMQNAFAWAPSIRAEGTVHTPNADAQIASVDVRDIAAAAVAALTGDGHEGRAYELSGPEALTRHEQVATIGAALGRDLTIDALTADQARAFMTSAGYPEYAVGGLYELIVDVYDAGHAATVYPGVEQATGRPPRSWADFARDHVAVWS